MPASTVGLAATKNYNQDRSEGDRRGLVYQQRQAVKAGLQRWQQTHYDREQYREGTASNSPLAADASVANADRASSGKFFGGTM